MIARALAKDRRPPDGLLHPSGDLVGSLRHAMLTAAGAPTIESPIAAQMPLLIGTEIHKWLGAAFEAEGIPVLREVKLAQWLPEGWSGTADFLFYDPSNDGWVLGDLKTQKGESYKFTRDGGAKTEHIWQVSAYWHALVEMGLPMVNKFGVIYLPKNDTTDKNERVEVIVAECKPLPREQVWEQMEARWAATKAYLDALWYDGAKHHSPHYDNEYLAPVQDRVQKMWWQAKTATWDVKLVPHWSADYCPFPNELCDCSEQGTTKVGHWHLVDGELVYQPRKGYEEHEPAEKPSPKEVKKRSGKHNPKPVEGTSESTE